MVCLRFFSIKRGLSPILFDSSPRIPCAKLAVRVGEPDFTNKFLMAGKLGYYLYVDEPGIIQQGDDMSLLHKADHGVTVARLWQTTFTLERDLELVAAAMDFPHLDEGWKKRLRPLLK